LPLRDDDSDWRVAGPFFDDHGDEIETFGWDDSRSNSPVWSDRSLSPQRNASPSRGEEEGAGWYSLVPFGVGGAEEEMRGLGEDGEQDEGGSVV
jgi:hypothetical protein